jgi:hypothetical protein
MPLTFPVVLGLCFAVAGVLLVVVGVRVARAQRAFARRAHETDAQVVDLRHRVIGTPTRGVGGAGTWFPVVRFALPDGRWVDATTTFGTNPPPAQPGAWVRVRYDPEEPTRVALAGGLGSGEALGPVLVVVGGFVAAGGVLVAGVGWVLAGLA